jgi:hypothetical protein
MVLIKNVATTFKQDRYFKAQSYTISTKVVDEATWALPSQVAQQTINYLTCTKKIKFLSYHFPQNHFEFFSQIQRFMIWWCQMFIDRSFILK